MVREFGYWMNNRPLPSAAYRALMSGSLISIGKCPVVRPVLVGKTWRRLIAKCSVMTGVETKEECRTEQLCRWLESRIEGGYSWGADPVSEART